MTLSKRILQSLRALIAPFSRSPSGAMPYTEFTFAALGRIAVAAGGCAPPISPSHNA